MELKPFPGFIRGRPWSKQEKQFLQDHHATMSDKAIGKAINRHHGSVRSKLIQLGLKKAFY